MPLLATTVACELRSRRGTTTSFASASASTLALVLATTFRGSCRTLVNRVPLELAVAALAFSFHDLIGLCWNAITCRGDRSTVALDEVVDVEGLVDVEVVDVVSNLMLNDFALAFE